MKWTILVGILGVGVVYLLGRGNGEAERVVDEGGEVVRSERRVGRSGGRSRGSSGRKGSKEVVNGALSEFGTYGRTSDLARARLMKWVLELDASEFPEVMESLGRLNHLDPEGMMDPFGGTRSVDYVRLGLARWYELEGALALDWVVGNSAFSEKWDGDRLILDAIRDGYERDPGKAFELFKEHLLRAKRSGKIKREKVVEWYYEIGKWSGSVERDLGKLVALGEQLDIQEEDADADPFSDESGSLMDSLMDGMLTSGRENELRDLLAKVAPEKLDDLRDKKQDRKLKSLGDADWKVIKAAIDSGELSRTKRPMWKALSDWSSQDRDKAIEWYLDGEIEGMSRAEQISALVFDRALSFESETMEGENSENGAILRFLDHLEAGGEPVTAAREQLVENVSPFSSWDSLATLEGKISASSWERVLSGVKRDAIDVDSIRWEGGEPLKFLAISEADSELLERFGIQEEAFEEVARTNEASLKELQRRLGAE